MTKLLFYKIAAGFLLVLNIAFLAFGLLHKPPAKKHEDPQTRQAPKTQIIERLNFDDTQVKAFDVLIEEHKSSVKKHDKKIKDLKKKLYSSLASDAKSFNEDSLIQNLTEAKMQIEIAHLQHFKGLKNICREDQLPAFDDLSKELGRLFDPKKSGAKRPPPR